MWNLRNWLLAIAIAVLCVGLAACAAEPPMDETGMEAEPEGGEAAAEGDDSHDGDEGEEHDGGEEDDDGDEIGDEDHSASEEGASE